MIANWLFSADMNSKTSAQKYRRMGKRPSRDVAFANSVPAGFASRRLSAENAKRHGLLPAPRPEKEIRTRAPKFPSQSLTTEIFVALAVTGFGNPFPSIRKQRKGSDGPYGPGSGIAEAPAVCAPQNRELLRVTGKPLQFQIVIGQMPDDPFAHLENDVVATQEFSPHKIKTELGDLLDDHIVCVPMSRETLNKVQTL